MVDLLTGLTDRCVSLLGVSAAGVMLASPAGSLGLVASSSEAMRLLELFELQAQEGPCLDAFRTGERVGHENLAAGSGRWPSFSAAALRPGSPRRPRCRCATHPAWQRPSRTGYRDRPGPACGRLAVPRPAQLPTR